jgi:hypothetical protein
MHDASDDTDEIDPRVPVAHVDRARRSAARVSVPAVPTTELASAFHSAQHDGACREPHVAPLASSDDCSELRDAIHAFVAVGRAAGAPPERVLVDLKRETRPAYVEGGDGLHGDRLQTLVMREFLASYYDAAASVEPAPEIRE